MKYHLILALVSFTLSGASMAEELCSKIVGSYKCQRVDEDKTANRISRSTETIIVSIVKAHRFPTEKTLRFNTSLGYNFNYGINFNQPGFLLTNGQANCFQDKIEISMDFERSNGELYEIWSGVITPTAQGFNSTEKRVVRGGEITRKCIKQ